MFENWQLNRLIERRKLGRLLTVFCGWLPRCKHKVMIWPLVGCSRLSGLLMQSVRLLALMVSANKVRSA